MVRVVELGGQKHIFPFDNAFGNAFSQSVADLILHIAGVGWKKTTLN